MTSHMGELLVKGKVITEEQLEQALQIMKKEGGRLETTLIKLKLVGENDVAKYLSKRYGIPFVDLANMEVVPEVAQLVRVDKAQKHMVLPVERVGTTLTLAMVDPTDMNAVDDIRFMTGFNVKRVVVSETALRSTIDRFFDASQTLADVMGEMDDRGMEVVEELPEESDQELRQASEDAPVVKLVNILLADAIKRRASDIHIEPYEKTFRIRFRIDGILYEVMQPPMRLKAAMVSRIKIMSELDIAERRLPQDGRMKVRMKDKEVDFRVSILPTLFGEKVVMRLLDKSNLMLDMTKLGFDEKALADFMSAIKSPFGMILVTGPTGSGKTTTLYSALDFINTIETNIMTAEDPVEFNIGGINQVQVRESIGLTFAASLRSFLRQDPDVVMVGEVRDYETAEIAVKAALTGHLVLSTLHTNDAPSTINRLLNMGVEAFLVSSSVLLIIAQRLARRICQNCKERKAVAPKALMDIGMAREHAESLEYYEGKGCPECNDTGYRGRVALYEVMPIGEEIRELILRGATANEIKKEAVRLGMQTLRMAGISKIRAGITTIDEVLRVSFKD